MKVGSGEWAVGSGESRLSWNRCEHNSWSLLQKILQTPPRVLPASSGRELIFLASPQGIGGTQGGLVLACARDTMSCAHEHWMKVFPRKF